MNIKYLTIAIALTCLCTACHGGNNQQGEKSTDSTAIDTTAQQPAQIETFADDAPGDGTSFIVISKKNLTLRVYDRDPATGDTVVVAQFPACLSKNRGDKQRKGDMRTPQSPHDKPFSITAIQDASTWKHDFGDGRGSILAYGHWFLRLHTPGHSGIGIHGSTNNENSVPGRASEGCIRLLDDDIVTLKERYARVGMPVYIHAEDEDNYAWEQRAHRVAQ